jgi:hypothetical protein
MRPEQLPSTVRRSLVILTAACMRSHSNASISRNVIDALELDDERVPSLTVLLIDGCGTRARHPYRAHVGLAGLGSTETELIGSLFHEREISKVLVWLSRSNSDAESFAYVDCLVF